MSESQSVSRSRLELARDEVDRVFGDGHAAAHPELVVAIVHAASSDWAARVITAGLQDIAVALVEGGVELPGCHSACNFDPLNRGIGVQN
jgi:hypothetical protein